MKLSDTSRPRPTEARADFQGEEIIFTYDRAKITGDIFEKPAEPAAIAGGMATRTTRAERLARLLLSWDITNDDGSAYQPPKDAADRVQAWEALLTPMAQDVLRAVEDALWDDFNAGK